MQFDTIIMEGVDKTGKDLIIKYIDMLCDHKYVIYQRGYISNTVYAKLYDRPEIEYKLSKNCVYILLTADIEDLKIRFSINDEPNIDIEKHLDMFNKVFNEMTEGYMRMKYNTSHISPYDVAKNILSVLDTINGDKTY